MPDARNAASYSKRICRSLNARRPTLRCSALLLWPGASQINSQQLCRTICHGCFLFCPVAPRRRAGVASKASSDWVAEMAKLSAANLSKSSQTIEHQGQIEK